MGWAADVEAGNGVLAAAGVADGGTLAPPWLGNCPRTTSGATPLGGQPRASSARKALTQLAFEGSLKALGSVRLELAQRKDPAH